MDLATYLATILVGLFDPARLELLPDAFADYRSLRDPTVVTRALLAQVNYIVDVAVNMPANTHTTASGVFRLADGQQLRGWNSSSSSLIWPRIVLCATFRAVLSQLFNSFKTVLLGQTSCSLRFVRTFGSYY